MGSNRLLSRTNHMLNSLEIKMKRTHLISRPVEISLEPTINCNSNCVMCTKRFLREQTIKGNEYLSWDIFWKVKPYFKYAARILFSGFGEPLLHPEYLAMAKEIKKSGPFVYLFTNASMMTDEIGRGLVDAEIDMICISMGGATRKTYNKIRRIDAFETVVENLRNIQSYKQKMKLKKPFITFNVVAMNSVMPELEAHVQLAKDFGVDYIALPNLIVQSDIMKEESVWADPEMAQKDFKKAGELAQKYNITFVPPSLNIGMTDCKDIFKKAFITWDGRVLSCAQERYIIGNLKENNLSSIWNGDGIVRLRKDYYQKGVEVICKNCPCLDNRPETFLNSRINSREFAEKLY